MDGLTPLEDIEAEFAAEERKVNRDLSIRRLRARIDRALDVGNRRQFRRRAVGHPRQVGPSRRPAESLRRPPAGDAT